MANWQDRARDAALRYGLDPNIFVRQIRQESNFDPNVTSPAGAIGIAQIMPATARAWGVDPHDPAASLNAAAKNMADYVKKYGSYRNALVAYNAGPGRVGGALPAETQNYIKTILFNGRDPGTLGQPSAGGGPPATPHGLSADPVQSLTQPVDMGANSGAATTLLQAALSGARRQPVATSALQAPAVTAGPVLPDAYKALTSTQGPAPRQDVGALISAAMTQGGGTGVTAPQTDASAPPSASDAAAGGQTTPNAPGGGNSLVDAITAKANQIDARKLPYEWGGGHEGRVNLGKVDGLDCSGAVSAILGINPRVSGQFESFGEKGRGDRVTIYANGHHVLMEVDGHFWGTSKTNPGGGAGWIPRSAISPSYLKNFTARHPRGM